MEYRKFVDALIERIKEMTGRKEVCFREGDNALPEDSIMVALGEDEKDKFVYRLLSGDVYREYLSGYSMDRLLKEISDGIREAEKLGIGAKMMETKVYEKVKGSLFIKPMNYERNREKLQDTVYRRNGDIALVLCHKIAEADGSLMSGYILSAVAEKWGVDEDLAFEEALKNTVRILPPRIMCFEKMLFIEDYEGDDLMDSKYELSEIQKTIGTCVSVAGRCNGAAAVFEPGVAKRLSDLMGGDLYFAFTSIHEAMVHNAELTDLAGMKEVIKATVRDCTQKEEFMSLNIYRYSREKNRIEMLPSDEDA